MNEENINTPPRSELIFIYDIKDANPNGDPLQDNRPRMDDLTGCVLVSDLRLKRFIRDYWISKFGINAVFVVRREQEGNVLVREERVEELIEGGIISKENFVEDVIKKFIDHRVFGALVTVKGKGKEQKERLRPVSKIGPVQFAFGRSLHRVEPTMHQGISVFASRENRLQGTLISWWTVPYAVICFYGIINDVCAEETGMTVKDKEELMEAMWHGIEHYTSRTKHSHRPLLLIDVEYKEEYFQIGRIDEYVRLRILKKDLPEEAIRKLEDYAIDLTSLVNVLNEFKDRISKVRVRARHDLRICIGDEVFEGREIVEKLKSTLHEIPVEELTFPS